MPEYESHFAVVSVGSAGDMYPFMNLAKTLQSLGRKVTFMGPAFHSELVQQEGLPFIAIGTPEDYLTAISDPDLWHPRKGLAALLRNYGSHLHQIRSELDSLPSEERCVIIAHPLALPGAALVRAARPNIKIVGAYLAPSNLRTCHDPLNIGPLQVPRWVPMDWRKWLWRMIDTRMIDPVASREVNAARKSVGLQPIGSFVEHMASVPDLSVTLFPPWFSEPQPDWPSPLHMGDFQLYDPSANQTLPADLTHFLSAGEPPIVFTPGSAHHHATSYFSNALLVVRRLGRRAIFLTRHRAQVPSELPDSVHWQPYISLGTLLPHVSALVHHGGIGTTAEALRAGVAQLVIPFAWDQFDNAARVVSLGVGSSIPASRLGARNLERKLRAILSSSAVRTQCTRVATRFAGTNGADRLCRDIETSLGIAQEEDVAPESSSA